VSTIAIDENEQLLCSGGRDTQTILWDLTTGNIVSKNAISQNVVTCSRWIRGESLVVQGSEDLSLKIWDCRCPFRVPSQLIHGYVNFPLSVDISSDGNYILTSSKGFDGVGCEGRLWDRRSGKQLLQLNGHQQDATCCGFVSDVTSSIPPSVTASKDGYVKVWDSSGKVLCETQDSQGGMYTSLSISRKTDKFAHVLTGTFDGSVEMLSVDLKTNTIVPL
jgi:mitogen-activated protein kinase organizer 1